MYLSVELCPNAVSANLCIYIHSRLFLMSFIHWFNFCTYLQLLKECARGDEHYEDLQSAQEMVQFQLRHGNDLLAMDSLRDCDVCIMCIFIYL